MRTAVIRCLCRSITRGSNCPVCPRLFIGRRVQGGPISTCWSCIISHHPSLTALSLHGSSII
ncbi:hypothetical protein BDQ17DRAFT_1370695 [Cyathus striatus]|nr:hypothetical protein BDQ17DRAFT_1370695 [Cyathus striatus]